MSVIGAFFLGVGSTLAVVGLTWDFIEWRRYRRAERNGGGQNL